MRKSGVALWIGLIALVLAGLNLFQHRKILRLQAERVTPPLSCPPPTLPPVRSPGEPPEPGRTTDGRAVPAQATGKAPAQTANSSPMAGMARMALTSGMKELLRAQQKGQMDLLYGSLFKYLELSGVDVDAVRETLLDRQMAILSLALDSTGKLTSPEERGAKIRAANAGFDARIRELLGEEDFEIYEAYEATQAERVQVTLFKGGLPPEDRLTEEQEDRLIRTLHEERSRSGVATEEFGERMADPSRLTPDQIESMLDASAKLREQYITRAASILTPRQLVQFKASQQQQQALLDMGLKMSASLREPAPGPSGDGP